MPAEHCLFPSCPRVQVKCASMHKAAALICAELCVACASLTALMVQASGTYVASQHVPVCIAVVHSASHMQICRRPSLCMAS